MRGLVMGSPRNLVSSGELWNCCGGTTTRASPRKESGEQPPARIPQPGQTRHPSLAALQSRHQAVEAVGTSVRIFQVWLELVLDRPVDAAIAFTARCSGQDQGATMEAAGSYASSHASAVASTVG